jgi:hypothetical protein
MWMRVKTEFCKTRNNKCKENGMKNSISEKNKTKQQEETRQQNSEVL